MDASDISVVLELNGADAQSLIHKRPVIVSQQNYTTCLLLHAARWRASMTYLNPQPDWWLRSTCFLVRNGVSDADKELQPTCHLYTNKCGNQCAKLNTVRLKHNKDKTLETMWGVAGAAMYAELRHADDVASGIDVDIDLLHVLCLLAPHTDNAGGTITIENIKPPDTKHSHAQLLSLWHRIDAHSEPLFIGTVEAFAYQSRRANGHSAPTDTRVHVTCPSLFWAEVHRLCAMSAPADFETHTAQRKDLIRISTNSVVWIVSDKTCKHRINAVSVADMRVESN